MPRKSASSTAAARDANGDVSMVSEAPTVSSPKQTQPKETAEKPEKQSKKKNEGDVVALDDLLLPRTITQRICKGVLPANTSIHRDAILALTKSATVFISHLASEANDLTERKTIQPGDVLKALHEIEMDKVMQLGVLGADGKRGGRVEREVEKWEGDVRGKRRGYREKVKARESGAGDTTMGDTTVGDNEEQEYKKARIGDSGGADGEAERAMNAAPNVDGHGRRKSGESKNRVDGAEDDTEDEDNEDEENEDEDEDDEEQEETQDAEDTMEMDDADRDRRKNGPLAPDGRIEVGGTDDESD